MVQKSYEETQLHHHRSQIYSHVYSWVETWIIVKMKHDYDVIIIVHRLTHTIYSWMETPHICVGERVKSWRHDFSCSRTNKDTSSLPQ